jgi:putative heme-binding domain-containing protein
LSLLSPHQTVELQLAAVRALSAFDHPDVASQLVQSWRELTPTVRREAAEALLARSDRTKTLLQAVRDGKISAAEVDPTRHKALLEHRDPTIRNVAKEILEGTTRTRRADVVRQYQGSLSHKGDGSRGEAVFKSKCATCHVFASKGKNVGPDLTTVQNRSAEQLLLHILDPNRDVKPQYETYLAITGDGRTFSGIIVEEGSTSITLRRAEGAEDVLLRSRIENIRSTGMSLMPEGLENGISFQQMADLIQFLRPSTR